MITDYKPKLYIPALTSLRAIAAFMVFLHHFNFLPTFDNTFLHLFYFQGYAGVSLFFILSGFLIHRNYIRNLSAPVSALGRNSTTKFLKTYFLNRFARVYPMYFIILVITFVSYGVTNYYQWGIHLTLLKGFSNAHKFSGVATAWSLTVEECFYFLFPILALARIKKIPYLILLILIYLLGWFLFYVGDYHQFEGFFYPEQFVLLYTFFGRAFEFILGMLVSELILTNKIKNFKNPVYTYTGIIFSFATIVALTFIAFYSRVTENEKQVVAMFTSEGLLVHNFILPIGFALIILGLATENSRLQNFMSLPVFELFGRSSYIFYLLQAGVFQMYLTYYLPNPENYIIFISMLVTSITLFLFVEDPLNRLIRGQKNVYIEFKKLLVFKKLAAKKQSS